MPQLPPGKPGDVNKAGKGDDAEDQKAKAENLAARLKHLLGKAKGYYPNPEKRKTYTDAAKRATSGIWRLTVVTGRAIDSAAERAIEASDPVVDRMLSPIRWTARKAWAVNRSADDKIAIASVIMAITAVLEFWLLRQQSQMLNSQTFEMHRQSEISDKQLGAMVRQNNEIIKQSDLARGQLKVAQGQIDAILQEQRPWLGATTPQMAALTAGEKVRPSFTIKNFGKTPGRITGWVAVAFTADAGSLDASIKVLDLVFSSLGAQENVIAPDSGVNMVVEDGPTMSPERIGKIESGAENLYVRGLWSYTDMTGGKHRSSCCFRYNVPTKELYLNHKYNSME